LQCSNFHSICCKYPLDHNILLLTGLLSPFHLHFISHCIHFLLSVHFFFHFFLNIEMRFTFFQLSIHFIRTFLQQENIFGLLLLLFGEQDWHIIFEDVLVVVVEDLDMVLNVKTGGQITLSFNIIIKCWNVVWCEMLLWLIFV
jgi:hypothetical protein